MDAHFRPAFFRRAVRRRWPSVLLGLLLGLLAAAGTVLTAPTDYRSTSVVFLDPLVGNPYSPTTPSTRQEQLTALTTEAGLVLTDAVVRAAESAAQGAGVALGSGVQERVATEVPSNSQVVHISFTAGTPEAARFGAQALAEAYLDHRQERATAVIEGQVARAEEEIASLSDLLETASLALDAFGSEDAASAEVLNLQEQVRIYANQLGQLRIERAAVENASLSPGEIVSPAQAPGRPEGVPAPLIAAALVLVLLGGGLVLAVVREHLDTRVRAPEDVDAIGISPVRGPLVPWHPELRGSATEDSYRLAVNTLQVDATRRGVVALLGAGMSVPAGVTAGLAQTLADAGRTVVVVAVEPSAEEQRLGLSDALQDGKVPEVGAILREVQPGLHLLGPGRDGADLATLMQRPVFAELLESLAVTCDVLFVAGPDASSATGSAAARLSGGAIVVAAVGTTRGAQLLTSARVLEDAGARLEGVLLAQPLARRPRGRRRSSTVEEPLEVLLEAPAPEVGTPAEPARGQSGNRLRERLRTGGS